MCVCACACVRVCVRVSTLACACVCVSECACMCARVHVCEAVCVLDVYSHMCGCDMCGVSVERVWCSVVVSLTRVPIVLIVYRHINQMMYRSQPMVLLTNL